MNSAMPFLRLRAPFLSSSFPAPQATSQRIGDTVNLEKLHDRLHGTRSFEDLEWLKDSAAVLESLQKRKHCVSYLAQRNYLDAMVVVLPNRDGFQTALHTYQAHRDKFNDQYMEIQQTKEPSAKQAQNWVPLSEIRELIDE